MRLGGGGADMYDILIGIMAAEILVLIGTATGP